MRCGTQGDMRGERLGIADWGLGIGAHGRVDRVDEVDRVDMTREEERTQTGVPRAHSRAPLRATGIRGEPGARCSRSPERNPEKAAAALPHSKDCHSVSQAM